MPSQQRRSVKTVAGAVLITYNKTKLKETSFQEVAAVMQ